MFFVKCDFIAETLVLTPCELRKLLKCLYVVN